MKLGIAIPSELVDNIISHIRSSFPTISFIPFSYEHFSDLPTSLSGQQSRLDVLLFLGNTALAYTNTQLVATIPWKTVPRNSASLLRVFVKMSIAGRDLYDISTDLQTQALFHKAYAEIDLDSTVAKVNVIPSFPYNDQFMLNNYNAHVTAYRQNQSCCCITIFSETYRNLAKNHIPAYYLYSSLDDIDNTIRQTHFNYLLSISRQSQLIVLSILLDSPNEYSVLNNDEYQYIVNQTVATRLIYKFAQSIKAAVSESGPREYILFSTRAIAEQATNHFTQIALMHQIQSQIAITLSIGVGYGITAWEAKTNARRGMFRASKNGGNQVFVVYDNDHIISTLQAQSSSLNVLPPKINGILQSIAEKSGISIKTISLLNRITIEYGKTQFTPAELADLLAITLRSVNRILAKLIANGYCTEVGKRFHCKKGRPCRVINLQLT